MCLAPSLPQDLEPGVVDRPPASPRGRRAGAARVRGSGSGGAPGDSRRPLVATTSVPTPATMSRFLAPRSALLLVSVSTT